MRGATIPVEEVEATPGTVSSSCEMHALKDATPQRESLANPAGAAARESKSLTRVKMPTCAICPVLKVNSYCVIQLT
jgi:hypothetical protein